MSSKMVRLKVRAIHAPGTQAEAEELIAQIGRIQREHARVQAQMNDAIEAARSAFQEPARLLNEQISERFAAVHAWAETRRAELTREGKTKTVRLATGDICWRTTPPSVRLTQPEVVLERLRGLGLNDLIRSKEEISKEAILADPERVAHVKGISISQREEFAVKPHESALELAETVARAEAA